MTLRKAIEVVASLEEKGVLRRYAVAGAVAALNYIEPTLTEDLDILISVGELQTHKSGLILLTPITEALAQLGYNDRAGEGDLIEGWPVQFLPAVSPLDEEALEKAGNAEFGNGESVTVPCLRPEHVVATAVSLGRPKDWARVHAFLDEDAVDLGALKGVLYRYELGERWKQFCRNAGMKDPLDQA